jgi:hypothetical protein
MAPNFTVVSTFQFALQRIINKQLCQRNCRVKYFTIAILWLCKFCRSPPDFLAQQKVKPLCPSPTPPAWILLARSKTTKKRYLWHFIKCHKESDACRQQKERKSLSRSKTKATERLKKRKKISRRRNSPKTSSRCEFASI